MAKSMTVEELRGLARQQQGEVAPPPPHSNVANQRLPKEFDRLRTVGHAKGYKGGYKKGHLGFEDVLIGTIRGFDTNPEEITPHVVYGLCQLVHEVRDRAGGRSKQQAFARVIARLLDVKAKMGERTGKPLVDLLLRTLDPEGEKQKLERAQRENQEKHRRANGQTGKEISHLGLM